MHGNPEHSPRSHNVRQGHAAVRTAGRNQHGKETKKIKPQVVEPTT
jgi:hypothetical protein